MAELVVGVALTSRQWRGEFQRHVHNHATGVRLLIVRDSRVALESQLDVLVIDAECTWITPTVAGRVRQTGCRLVGVIDPEEGDTESLLLERLGFDTTVIEPFDPEELLEACFDLFPTRPTSTVEPTRSSSTSTPGGEDRFLVAVGGPAGVGRTEVALAIAAIAAGEGRALLIDGDEFCPSLAPRLRLPRHPNVLSAIDLLRGDSAEHVVGVDAVRRSLARPTSGQLPFDVLAGLAGKGDWMSVREDVARELLDATGRWRTVVADVAPSLERFERYQIERFPLSRLLVASADVAVVVTEPTPKGVMHALGWVADVLETSPWAAVHLAVNRTPRGRFVRAELQRELAELGESRLAGLWFLPEDDRVSVAAWNGDLVTGGRFTRAVARMVQAISATRPVRPAHSTAAMSVTVEVAG